MVVALLLLLLFYRVVDVLIVFGCALRTRVRDNAWSTTHAHAHTDVNSPVHGDHFWNHYRFRKPRRTVVISAFSFVRPCRRRRRRRRCRAFSRRTVRPRPFDQPILETDAILQYHHTPYVCVKPCHRRRALPVRHSRTPIRRRYCARDTLVSPLHRRCTCAFPVAACDESFALALPLRFSPNHALGPSRLGASRSIPPSDDCPLTCLSTNFTTDRCRCECVQCLKTDWSDTHPRCRLTAVSLFGPRWPHQPWFLALFMFSTRRLLSVGHRYSLLIMSTTPTPRSPNNSGRRGVTATLPVVAAVQSNPPSSPNIGSETTKEVKPNPKMSKALSTSTKRWAKSPLLLCIVFNYCQVLTLAKLIILIWAISFNIT